MLRGNEFVFIEWYYKKGFGTRYTGFLDELDDEDLYLAIVNNSEYNSDLDCYEVHFNGFMYRTHVE